jgi:hypothetical protein
VGCFELLEAHASEMAMTACQIVERYDVVGDVGRS